MSRTSLGARLLVALLAIFAGGCARETAPAPRADAQVAVLLVAMFAANLIVGPDISARVFWPLPAAPLLLLLAIGGQGYRYWRRSTAAATVDFPDPDSPVSQTVTPVTPRASQRSRRGRSESCHTTFSLTMAGG